MSTPKPPAPTNSGPLYEAALRLISTDPDNQIVIGSDGKLFVGAVDTGTPPLSRTELETKTKAELENIAAERGILVEGTGVGGTVLKSDLIDAILAEG